jgi:hypothetical protein
MYKENISTKAIWDFTKEDTIYISKKISGGNDHTFFCQFEKLVRNTVYGKVLEIDKGTSWNGVKVGDVIYAEIKKCGLYGRGGNDSNTHYHWFNVMGYAFKDIEEEVTEKIIKHPSFGMIGLSRRSSSGVVPLFGSNIQHQHTITLTIKRGEHHRRLNNDWIHGTEQLIEVELSGSQYAELISSFNQGDGIPCTIRQLGRESYPDPPYESPMDIFQREFAAHMKNLGKECSSVIEDAVKMLDEKPSIGKADREFLKRAIERLITEISSNVPFVSQQFLESMDKTVSQAKSEIETFVTNKITSIGLDAIKKNPELFLGTKIDDNKKIEDEKK